MGGGGNQVSQKGRQSNTSARSIKETYSQNHKVFVFLLLHLQTIEITSTKWTKKEKKNCCYSWTIWLLPILIDIRPRTMLITLSSSGVNNKKTICMRFAITHNHNGFSISPAADVHAEWFFRRSNCIISFRSTLARILYLNKTISKIGYAMLT